MQSTKNSPKLNSPKLSKDEPTAEQIEPTAEQIKFLSNVTKKPPTNNSWVGMGRDRYRNTRNIIDGGILQDYREYLQEKCNELCRFRVMPKYKVLYETNSIIKEYIDIDKIISAINVIIAVKTKP